MSKARRKVIRLSRKWQIFLIVISLLILLRIFLPRIILFYANKSLANLEGYFGHINDIDLSIYRGAYQIDHIYINKVDTLSDNRIPFFDADLIDLSIEWNALLDGRIVGELTFHNPTLIFTKDKAEPEEVQKDTTDFKKVLKDLMPLKVNRFEIINGSIHYQDETTKPKVDIKMDQIHIIAHNLNNVKDTALLPGRIYGNANVYNGIFELDIRLDPLADDPTFDLNAELRNTSLPMFNDFFKAYGKLDVNKGTFGLYTEIAAKDKKFKGYVKPVINDIDVLGPEDRKDDLLRKAWEGVTGAVGQLIENQKKEQIATKIPIEGSFDNTTIGAWYAISTVLRNAFIQALYPALDYQISIGDVESEKKEDKTFLEKIFGGKDDKKKEKDSKDNKNAD